MKRIGIVSGVIIIVLLISIGWTLKKNMELSEHISSRILVNLRLVADYTNYDADLISAEGKEVYYRIEGVLDALSNDIDTYNILHRRNPLVLKEIVDDYKQLTAGMLTGARRKPEDYIYSQKMLDKIIKLFYFDENDLSLEKAAKKLKIADDRFEEQKASSGYYMIHSNIMALN